MNKIFVFLTMALMVLSIAGSAFPAASQTVQTDDEPVFEEVSEDVEEAAEDVKKEAAEAFKTKDDRKEEKKQDDKIDFHIRNNVLQP